MTENDAQDPIPFEDAEIDTSYFVEFGWADGSGTYRRPAYEARLLSKDVENGLVRLVRGVMSGTGRGTAWETVEHPLEHLVIHPWREGEKG